MKRISKKPAIVFAIIMSLLFVACGKVEEEQLQITDKSNNSYLQIDAVQAKQMMNTEKNYIILDVRTDEEYAQGHIPESILIPDYEITEKAESILTDKDQLILVYCRSGNRSKVASQALVDMGYTNVVEFGGIKSWPYEIIK